ncbi:unnamed protein product, partial [Meganyctiphanes norvegica]
MFNNELLYYLRNNLTNTIIGGDWNCILSKRDCESNSMQVSKSLTNLVRSIQLKDAWFIKNRNPEYTYIRNNYGSRLDRFYVKEIGKFINNINLCHVNFSDHSCVMMSLDLPNLPKMGKYYWKMNVELLNRIDIKDDFKKEWSKIKLSINNYESINTWWDMHAKIQIRNFFIDIGKKENQMKFGLLQYLEIKLNRLYDTLNKTGEINYNEVKSIKNRISMIKTKILEGVKIRNRMQDQIEGEKISAHLIGKQAKIKTKKAITAIKVEDNIVENLNSGTTIKDKDTIEWYISKYYEKLYKKENTDKNLQNWFLQFVDRKIDENENNRLEKNVLNQEILDAIKTMNLNKSPGIDGIPVEFYSKYWDIINVEFSEIIRNIVKGEKLTSYQRKAIITLIPKNGDLELL